MIDTSMDDVDNGFIYKGDSNEKLADYALEQEQVNKTSRDTVVKEKKARKPSAEVQAEAEKILETQTTLTEMARRYRQPTLEKNMGKRYTKSAGYIPIADQVRIMTDAGLNLEKLKGIGNYDFQDGAYTFETDPTRKQGMDLAEASQMQRENDKQIKASIRERRLRELAARQNLQNQNDPLKKVSTGDIINKELIAKNEEGQNANS